MRAGDKLVAEWNGWTCRETRTSPGERTLQSEMNRFHKGSIQLAWWQPEVLGVGGSWLTELLFGC